QHGSGTGGAVAVLGVLEAEAVVLECSVHLQRGQRQRTTLGSIRCVVLGSSPEPLPRLHGRPPPRLLSHDHGRGSMRHSASTTAAETVSDPRMHSVPPCDEGGPDTHVQPSTAALTGLSDPAGCLPRICW